jgi:hypothetical protein
LIEFTSAMGILSVMSPGDKPNAGVFAMLKGLKNTF